MVPSTTGCQTTSSRHGPCWTDRATSRSSGCRGPDLSLAAVAGRRTHTEGFPDRAYGADGRLVARTEPGAVLDDAEVIAARAVELAEAIDSVCVHGDTPGAVGDARAIRAALEAAGNRVHGLV